MDEFMLSNRYVSPIQRDVIVGGCEDAPDIGHFVSEEVVIGDTPLLSDRSYYGSCGEDSPVSSDDFLDDLIEIKEEKFDQEGGVEELTVAVDLAKFHRVSRSRTSSGEYDQEVVCDDDRIVVLNDDDSEETDDSFGKKRYVFLTEDGKPAQSLDDINGQTVELADSYIKPKLSYAQLIAEALMSADGRMLTLADIYTSVANRHPYYKMDHSRNWQNAIRHNLTLNKCFTKVPRPASEGRGSYWKLEAGAESTIFKRILARHHNRMKPTVQTFDCSKGIVYVTIPAESD